MSHLCQQGHECTWGGEGKCCTTPSPWLNSRGDDTREKEQPSQIVPQASCMAGLHAVRVTCWALRNKVEEGRRSAQMSCCRHVCGFTPFFSFLHPPPPPSINERQAPDRLAVSKAEQAETQKKRRKGLFSEVWRPSTFNPPPPLSQLAGCYPSAHPALLALGFLLLVTANSLQAQECACGLPREPEAQSFNMLPPFSPRASPA